MGLKNKDMQNLLMRIVNVRTLRACKSIDTLSIGEISTKLKTSFPTLWVRLKKLERLGLITIIKKETDSKVSLTELGLKIVAELEKIEQAISA